MGLSKNGAMNHSRAASAGPRITLERAPISLLTSANARCLIVRQRISHLRERGVIISDAEAKYQRWLAISAGKSPPPDPPSRPWTAVESSVRPNKASLLRKDHLPKAYAEPDYKMIARNRKEFDKRCKSASAVVTSMMSKESGNETLHEFLIGARYNCTHHVDSQSLERLGVYVPRSNVAGTFINPAGIIPPSKRYRQAQGRMSQAQSLDAPPTTIDSFSAGLLGLSMKKGSLSDVGSDVTMRSSMTSGGCSSASVLQDVELEDTESHVQEVERDDELDVVESINNCSNPSSLSNVQEHPEVTDEDNRQLLISEYAQQLTEEIMRHSLLQSTENQHREHGSPLRGMTVAALCDQLPTAQDGGDKQTHTAEVLQDRSQSQPPTSSVVPTILQAQSADSKHRDHSNPLYGQSVASLTEGITREHEGGSSSTAEKASALSQDLPTAEASVQTAPRVDSTHSETEPPHKFKASGSSTCSRLESETKLRVTSAHSSSSCLGSERSGRESCGSPEPSLLTSRKRESVHKSSSTIVVDLAKLQKSLED